MSFILYAEGGNVMPGICPSCGRQATIESEFCPACGAPMNPDAYRIQEERKQRNAILLPMKWYKFLTRFSLPAGGLLSLYYLYQAIRSFIDFQAELYRPEVLPLLRLLMALELILPALLVPCFILAEIRLLKMRWRGVGFLLFIFLSQAVSCFLSLILMLMILKGNVTPENIPVIIQAIIATAEMLIMFFANRTYFRKRKAMFQA